MSTPLFIRAVTVGEWVDVDGQSLAAFNPNSTTMDEIVPANDEPILIEDLIWSMHDFSTQAGMLVLALSNTTEGTIHRRVVGAYSIPAGSASLFANGRLKIDLVIEPGYYLLAAHNVKDSGGILYAGMNLTPQGGIIR